MADGVISMDVNEVLLPGVGLRYEFVNHEGDRVGVVAQRSGDFELVVYPGDDPDEARSVLRLTREEADTVAEILGAPRIAERFADLTREVPGLGAEQIEVRPGSPFAGRATAPGGRPCSPSWRPRVPSSRRSPHPAAGGIMSAGFCRTPTRSRSCSGFSASP